MSDAGVVCGHSRFVLDLRVVLDNSVLGLLETSFRLTLSLLLDESTEIELLIYISNKMPMLQSLFYLTTGLHVSGVIITHLQEHMHMPPTTHSNQFQHFHSDNNMVKLLPDAVVTIVLCS
jgi:hypothetical protein